MEDPVSGRRGSTPNFDDVGNMMEDHFYESESIKWYKIKYMTFSMLNCKVDFISQVYLSGCKNNSREE